MPDSPSRRARWYPWLMALGSALMAGVGMITFHLHSPFGICDFDETALAPVSWELSRLCVSLLLAANSIGMKKQASEALIRRCLDGYAAGMRGRLAGPVDRRTAQPDLHRFLNQLATNNQAALLKARTVGQGNKRRLLILKDKTLPARAAEKQHLKHWWKGHSRGPDLAGFGDLLDVARRITGTGSLGVRRYALLVAGGGEAHLLELKQAVPSAMAVLKRAPADTWPDEAERITAVQRRTQGVPRRSRCRGSGRSRTTRKAPSRPPATRP